MPDALPKHIDDYDIIKAFDRRQRVLLARDRRNDTKVVLKLALREQPNVEETSDDVPTPEPRIGNEAAILGEFQHDQIPRLLSKGTWHDYNYIVVEFMGEHTLETWLRQENPTLREAVTLLQQLADLLEQVHERGILHRDVKPKNVIVSESRLPCLIDFDIAVRCDDELTRRTIGEGPAFEIAPEAASGQWVDEKSDIFSFGCLLLAAMDHAKTRPDALVQIESQCRHQNPDRRYHSFGQVSRQLTQWLKEDQRWPSKPQRAVIAAIVGTSIVTAVVVYLVLPRNPQLSDPLLEAARRESRRHGVVSLHYSATPAVQPSGGVDVRCVNVTFSLDIEFEPQNGTIVSKRVMSSAYTDIVGEFPAGSPVTIRIAPASPGKFTQVTSVSVNGNHLGAFVGSTVLNLEPNDAVQLYFQDPLPPWNAILTRIQGEPVLVTHCRPLVDMFAVWSREGDVGLAERLTTAFVAMRDNAVAPESRGIECRAAELGIDVRVVDGFVPQALRSITPEELTAELTTAFRDLRDRPYPQDNGEKTIGSIISESASAD